MGPTSWRVIPWPNCCNCWRFDARSLPSDAGAGMTPCDERWCPSCTSRSGCRPGRTRQSTAGDVLYRRDPRRVVPSACSAAARRRHVRATGPASRRVPWGVKPWTRRRRAQELARLTAPPTSASSNVVRETRVIVISRRGRRRITLTVTSRAWQAHAALTREYRDAFVSGCGTNK